jgi:tyrosyl-tRNA synthetase
VDGRAGDPLVSAAPKAAPAGWLEELAWRGLLYQRTAGPELEAHLAQPRVGYCGFDPTAPSLTHGNLVPLTMLAHLQRAGHAPIALIGGGTGLIGDPSERDAERPLLSREQVEANVAGQRRIFERLLDFDRARPNAARLLDNAEWLCRLGFVDVLRDVGKHFSVNAMIQREAIRARLEDREQGISYTEFSYGILQAYDFLHLHRELRCTLQVAGSDQYGNVVAGIDLIHRTLGNRVEAYGVTAPLVTRSDGKKFSKSEGTAIWLTADRTSPYAFYQYWLNVPDTDAARFLKVYTLLRREEIEALAARHEAAPEKREAQRALASELTGRLHGQDELRRVQRASEAVFGRGDLRELDAATLAEVVAELPQSVEPRAALGGAGASLVEVLPRTTLASSKREARELLRTGAVSVNGTRAQEDAPLGEADLLPGGYVLLRRGKRVWHAIRWA